MARSNSAHRTWYFTLISGTFNVGMGDTFYATHPNSTATGTYEYLKPRMKYFVRHFQDMGPLRIEYLNPADDPRPTKALAQNEAGDLSCTKAVSI